MKPILITAVFAIVLFVFAPNIANATEQHTGCCVVALVPVFNYMPGVYILETTEGPVSVLFKRQVVMHANQVSHDTPATAMYHRCMCLSPDGHAGPNDPPQIRACQHQGNQISGSVDRDYVESEYCEWQDGIVSDSTCVSKPSPITCPTI